MCSVLLSETSMNSDELTLHFFPKFFLSLVITKLEKNNYEKRSLKGSDGQQIKGDKR